MIWSYEKGGMLPSNNYDHIVTGLLVNADRRMPYAVAK